MENNNSIPTIEDVNYYLGSVTSTRLTSNYDKYYNGYVAGITVDINNIRACSMARSFRLNFTASQVMVSSVNGLESQATTYLSMVAGNFGLELFSRFGYYTIDKLYGYYIWLSSGLSIAVFEDNGNSNSVNLNGALCFVNGGFDESYPNRIYISILVPLFFTKLPTLF